MSSRSSTLPFKLDKHIVAANRYGPATSIAEAQLSQSLAEIIKLASNESPLGPCPRAVAAIEGALANIHRYPAVAADALRRKLARHLGQGLGADDFVIGNGAVEVIDMLSRGLLRPGDNALISRPTFPLYAISANRCGAEVRSADFTADFTFDVDGILRAIDERTRIVYLCTPNNPTGTALPPAQASRLVAEIPARVVIVFDESYRPFIDEPALRIDTVGIIQAQRNVISLRSFSKSYGLAGLRVGYGIADPELAGYLQRLRHPFHSSDLALQAASAVLDDTDYVATLRQLVVQERGLLTDGMRALGLEVLPTQTNFITARASVPGQAVYEHMLPEGIIVRPLDLFDMPAWFRVSVGRPAENRRFLEVLGVVVDRLPQAGEAQPQAGSAGR